MPVGPFHPCQPISAPELTLVVWDSKPKEQGAPVNWVELKTTAEIRGPHDMEVFHRKLMKFWAQSFLLGVPKIIVGHRTRDGILVGVNEMETQKIPQMVNSQPNPAWNADMCVNFAGGFLECTVDPSSLPRSSLSLTCLGLKQGSQRRSMMKVSGGYGAELRHRQSRSLGWRRRGMEKYCRRSLRTGESN